MLELFDTWQYFLRKMSEILKLECFIAGNTREQIIALWNFFTGDCKPSYTNNLDLDEMLGNFGSHSLTQVVHHSSNSFSKLWGIVQSSFLAKVYKIVYIGKISWQWVISDALFLIFASTTFIYVCVIFFSRLCPHRSQIF